MPKALPLLVTTLIAMVAVSPAARPQTTTTARTAATATGPATNVELILDASGSMYAKLPAGGTRIAAAKDVLGSFISKLPADPNLNVGLRVYGSKVAAGKPGACKDSGLVIPMKGVDRTALRQTVVTTTPKGSTPIAYSLEQAANDFNNDKSRKLIVLVTDGIESCDGDLKKAMALFKEKSIVVDLRIIGIDLDAAAQKSFESIGTFENATSSEQLAAALGKATQAVAKPAETKLLVTVTITTSGKIIPSGAHVTFTNVVGTKMTTDFGNTNGKYTAQLAPGEYVAQVQTAGNNTATIGGLSVAVGSPNTFTFEVAQTTPVKLDFTPNPAQAGGQIKVTFSGAPAGSTKDWISAARKSDPDNQYSTWVVVKGASGTGDLLVPDELVEMELRYNQTNPDGSTRVIGRSAPFTPKRVGITLDAPAEVNAGSELKVKWTGPNNQLDYITIVPKGAPEGTWTDYKYTNQGNPVTITAPVVAGPYEIRYSSDVSRKTLASRPITVKLATYTLDAPSELPAGTAVIIKYTGPGNKQDYITIVKAGAPIGTYAEYFYTSTNPSPGKLFAPGEAGNYEIRYSTDAGNHPVFASRPLKVTATTYGLTAPKEAKAGDTIDIRWTGPNKVGDYITIVKKGAPVGSYEAYVYTRSGNPAKLPMPSTPGVYELRYSSEEVQPNPTLFTVPITIK
jgi:Ca-activated chloride channel homolog